MQAPHWPTPQPKRVPASFNSSRSTQSSGVSGSARTVRDCPFTVSVTAIFSDIEASSRDRLPGIEARNGYDVSQRYNAELAAAAEQERRGWKTADNKPVKNDDLWRTLEAMAAQHDVDWRWVRGHAGDPGNERADGLANRGAAEVR